MAVQIVCDLCETKLTPRKKGEYDYVSTGGVVVLVKNGYYQPCRLYYNGKAVNEVCWACVGKCCALHYYKGTTSERSIQLTDTTSESSYDFEGY